MGYTTEFKGKFSLTPSLSDEQRKYLKKFSQTRRMKRDPKKLMELFKGKGGYPGRTGTPEEIYGNQGQFFVGGEGFRGQDRDGSVIDGNYPPMGQPSLWCQWIPNKDGNKLKWDGGEKFYHYTEWLEYLIRNFFEPWGIKVSGVVKWEGEDSDDMGKIVVVNNEVTVLKANISYE